MLSYAGISMSLARLNAPVLIEFSCLLSVSSHVVGVEFNKLQMAGFLWVSRVALERLGKVRMPKSQGMDVEGASVLLTSDMPSIVSERLHLRGMFKQNKAEPDVSMWCSSFDERIKNTCLSCCLVAAFHIIQCTHCSLYRAFCRTVPINTVCQNWKILMNTRWHQVFIFFGRDLKWPLSQGMKQSRF